MNNPIPPEDEFREAMTIQPDETNQCPTDFDGSGWPGDGSGTDDLADYNVNEADDYNNE